MAAVQNIQMLSCSDIYFVNDDGEYRLQWSTSALIEGLSKPVLDDDDYDEYYRQLAKYNYIKKHKNDSSNTAAKFLCRVYDYQTGNLIDSIQTDGFCAEFDLESGEYLWDVQALDDKGNVITSSGKIIFVPSHATITPLVFLRKTVPSITPSPTPATVMATVSDWPLQSKSTAMTAILQISSFAARVRMVPTWIGKPP